MGTSPQLHQATGWCDTDDPEPRLGQRLSTWGWVAEDSCGDVETETECRHWCARTPGHAGLHAARHGKGMVVAVWR